MKYKLQIVNSEVIIVPIYRENIKSGLKFLYKEILLYNNSKRYCVTNLKILIKEPTIVKAKSFTKGVRTKYTTIQEISYDELMLEFNN